MVKTKKGKNKYIYQRDSLILFLNGESVKIKIYTKMQRVCKHTHK